MKTSKKILSLLLVFTMVISICIVPAAADVPSAIESGKQTFWNYLKMVGTYPGEAFKEWWSVLWDKPDPKAAYAEKVKSMPVNGIGSDGGFYWFPTSSDVSKIEVTIKSSASPVTVTSSIYKDG